jgi:hypothetical protein
MFLLVEELQATSQQPSRHIVAMSSTTAPVSPENAHQQQVDADLRRYYCSGCSCFLPGTSFHASSLACGKRSCKICRVGENRAFRRAHWATCAAATCRAAARRKGEFLSLSAGDVKEAMRRWSHQCPVTGERDEANLSLIRGDPSKPLSAANLVPIERSLARRIRATEHARGRSAMVVKERRNWSSLSGLPIPSDLLADYIKNIFEKAAPAVQMVAAT